MGSGRVELCPVGPRCLGQLADSHDASLDRWPSIPVDTGRPLPGDLDVVLARDLQLVPASELPRQDLPRAQRISSLM